MANAAAITVTDLVANGEVARPAADVLDTGGDPVTISAEAPENGTDRLLLEVTNKAAEDLRVDVLGDTGAASYKGTIAPITKEGIAQDAVYLFGPFLPERYASNGQLTVTFTPGGAAIGAEIRCYRLPASV